MKKLLISAVITMVFVTGLKSQVTISGSPCAVSGGEVGYLYTVTGKQESTDNLTWSITGGLIAGTSSNTSTGTLAAKGTQIRVLWNKGRTSGKIKVTNSRLGEFELTVRIIGYPNTISVPPTPVSVGSTITITGAGPSSGICTPLTNGWWEMAISNSGPFNEVENGTSANLTITATSGKKYYRRVLSINGDLLFSNIVSIDPK